MWKGTKSHAGSGEFVMRIGFAIWSLYSAKGGIQRLGVALGHAMQARGHEVTLFCPPPDPGQDARPVYPVDPLIRIVPLALHDPASMEHARKLVMSCGLDVFCAMFSWDALLWFPALLNGSGIPLCISEHNHPDIIENERWTRYERVACLAGADRIHLLNQQFASMLPEFLRERAAVIPNPAEPPCAAPADRAASPRKRIVAAGRLRESHKCFSLLIEAFALLAVRYPDWDVLICGDGEDRQQYEQLIACLHLGGRVSLPGNVDDMDAVYASGHVFCIPSRYEGFGLVTVEAQRHSLPVVGFAECSGTNEIVIHGENGLLAPEMTAAALAAVLRPLLTDAALRDKLGRRGAELLDRFEARKIYAQWEALLYETAQAKGKTRLNFPEQSEEEAALTKLREILNRKHPFIRPACAMAEREMRTQAATLDQAITLLRRHNIIE